MINVLDLFDGGTIRTKEGAPFVLVATLIEFDYPRCFVCSQSKDYFVFMECESDSNHLCWTVSKTSPALLNEVNLGKKNVQSLFNGELFEVNFDFSLELAELRDANPFHEIKGDFFSPNFGDMDELFDYHGLQSAAISDNENSISLVFEEMKCASTALILQAINYLKSLFKTIKYPFDILNTDLKLQRASTVITFVAKNESPKDASLIPDLEALGTDSFIELSNALASDDPDILLSYSDKPKQFLTKYKGLVDTLKKESDLKPKVVLAVSKLAKPQSFSLSENVAIKKRNTIRKAIGLAKDNTRIIKEGILSGIYSTKKGSFSFKSLDNIEYNGIVDIALLDRMDSFVVKGVVYKATIREIISMVDRKVLKKSYILKDLSALKRVERHLQQELI